MEEGQRKGAYQVMVGNTNVLEKELSKLNCSGQVEVRLDSENRRFS